MMKHSVYLCMLLNVVFAGCGESPTSVVSGPSVMVTYESQPLADVQVTLHATETGPALAQAVSASDGRAYFQNMPLPEPSEYLVSLQSLGDGGWILDPKYAQAAKSRLRLQPLTDSELQTIELPRGAVSALTPSRRR
ncbi:carboxypeptidase regulatory-like domain-containing protein [Allorhodopirellula heiligendammensis]|nr:carboxypeptidase regulatory-like domain-containing protein [Allorhodopirellula heiligendammensis]